MEIFKNTFSELCITYDKEYVDYNPQKWTGEIHIERNNDHFLQGKEYLSEVALLSLCNSFVAVQCNGTTGVMMMADNFEHTYFFDLGRY